MKGASLVERMHARRFDRAEFNCHASQIDREEWPWLLNRCVSMLNDPNSVEESCLGFLSCGVVLGGGLYLYFSKVSGARPGYYRRESHQPQRPLQLDDSSESKVLGDSSLDEVENRSSQLSRERVDAVCNTSHSRALGLKKSPSAEDLTKFSALVKARRVPDDFYLESDKSKSDTTGQEAVSSSFESSRVDGCVDLAEASSRKKVAPVTR